MQQFVSKNKVSVIPNPVGEDLIANVPLHFSKRILFQGNYAWLQNVEAVEVIVKKVFPLILKKVPDARLIISGQNADKVKHLKTQNLEIVDLEMGDIEGVKKAYHTSGLMLAPLYGPSGSRVKIVGAMAAKVPVVTTSIGIEGIDAKDGESVLIADSIEDLASQAVRLMTDIKLYEKIAKNARKLVEEKYTYQVISEKLDEIYREVTKK